MSDTTQTTQTQQDSTQSTSATTSSVAAITKRCPYDATALVKVWEEDLGCYCWECPLGDYIEPIL